MFPSSAQPVHAVFVKNRVARVARLCNVRVVCPIPYFPFERWVKKYSHRAAIPRKESVGGLDVIYPRFLSVPAVLKPLDGVFLFLSVWWAARRIRKELDIDLIDAHLAYPDGFAAVLLGWLFKKPVTVTLRGHDVNDLPRYPVRRRQVVFALKRASRVIAVADALRRAAVELGADPERTETISNGVDAALFYPCDRDEARRRLGLPPDRRIVVSVGHLCERKGHPLIVDALQVMRDRGQEIPFLAIVGGPGEEGDSTREIRERIACHSLEDSVCMAGAQLNDTLRDWYNAADVSCLASSKEGWANVLLESLACGTPVVATNVWGTPEVLSSEEYGVLVERSAESIANGLSKALSRSWNRSAIAAHARSQCWEAVAEKVLRSFERVLNGPKVEQLEGAGK